MAPRLIPSIMLAGVVGLLGACAPDEELPLPPVVWEGTTVRVRMDDPGIEVCGGSFEALDRHAELVRGVLLLDGDEVIDYSIGDAQFVDERCSSDSPIACTRTTTGAIFTTQPFIPHEIVHAVRVLDPHMTLRSSPFEEGLATYFGSDELDQRTVPIDAAEILEDPYVAGDDEYFRAGHLMALLLERHGIDRFRDFDLLANDGTEDETFTDVFDETKSELAAVADEAPICEQSQWWAPLLECDGDPTVADPVTGRVALAGNLRCDDARTNGPEYGRMWTSWHFRLDAPTNRLRYHFEIPDDSTLEIVSCNDGCPGRFAYAGTRYQLTSFGNGLPGLEPGEYYLRISRPVSDEDGRFEIVLE